MDPFQYLILICLLLLNTLIRGRAAVPDTLLRTLYLILIRLSIFVVIIIQIYVNYLAPADLPDFLRISSPTNLIPLPLYGSGLRKERILEQT